MVKNPKSASDFYFILTLLILWAAWKQNDVRLITGAISVCYLSAITTFVLSRRLFDDFVKGGEVRLGFVRCYLVS